jgi:SAM-dependent methyltransferase
MASEPGWVPPEEHIRRANPARVYDYLLGGTDNFLADQDVARALIALEPSSRAIAQANRAFLGRAVRFLAAAGIRQFLDIGSGIPTQGNVHEIAEQVSPDTRVVYADVDPIVIAHSKALLSGRQNAAIVEADLHEPAEILAHPDIGRLIDFSQPVGLLLVSVVHFLSDQDDPWRIVASLRDGLAPGSYLVLSHGTSEGKPDVIKAAENVYNANVSTSAHARSRAEILRLFDGFRLVDPGLVYIPEWRPDGPGDRPASPAQFGNMAGVAQKP